MAAITVTESKTLTVPKGASDSIALSIAETSGVNAIDIGLKTYVYTGGAWVFGRMYVYAGGAWKPVQPVIRDGGVWR
jgi:hypothetical protein